MRTSPPPESLALQLSACSSPARRTLPSDSAKISGLLQNTTRHRTDKSCTPPASDVGRPSPALSSFCMAGSKRQDSSAHLEVLLHSEAPSFPLVFAATAPFDAQMRAGSQQEAAMHRNAGLLEGPVLPHHLQVAREGDAAVEDDGGPEAQLRASGKDRPQEASNQRGNGGSPKLGVPYWGPCCKGVRCMLGVPPLFVNPHMRDPSPKD